MDSKSFVGMEVTAELLSEQKDRESKCQTYLWVPMRGPEDILSRFEGSSSAILRRFRSIRLRRVDNACKVS